MLRGVCRVSTSAPIPPIVGQAPAPLAPLVRSNILAQFVLLLAMFVKPMRIQQGSTQSGEAMYRRVVNKNIWCTVCIVISYTVTTVVVVLTYQGNSSKVRYILQTTTVVIFHLPFPPPRYLTKTVQV